MNPIQQEDVSSGDSDTPKDESPPTTSQSIDIEFVGTAEEYFRIWIVNILLTIVTLGIYAAWAKVRTRQYFYQHTLLTGQTFDYLASPVAILKGNLIIGISCILYFGTQFYDPTYSLIVMAVFFLVLPFLICKSLQFFAHNTAIRNIRFRFLGTLGESYKIYLLWPILIPLTLGSITPYWIYRQKKYFFDNLAFGTTEHSFRGRPGPFYKYYILAGIVGGICIMIPFSLYSAFFSQELFETMQANGNFGEMGDLNLSFYLFIGFFYFIFFVIGTMVQQYLYVRVTNYCWNETSCGPVRFESRLKVWPLIWIRFTNVLAYLFSLGLLIPWGKVRRTRYILENLSIIADGSLDDFTAATEPEVSAVGEAATGIFDIEIGL